MLSKLVIVAMVAVLPGVVGCNGIIGEPGTDEPPPGVWQPPRDPAGNWVDPWEGACELGGSVGPTPLRRLSSFDYQNSIEVVFGVGVDAQGMLPQDGELGPFSANVHTEPSDQDIETFIAVAELVATDVVGRLDALLPCASTGDAECAETFVRSYGRRAWRRPVTDVEVAALLEVHALGADFEQGVAGVVEALLTSPYFLYVVEGPADPQPAQIVELDAYERATRLSFFLWRSAPDEELLGAAASGELDTQEGMERQARRLIADEARYRATLRQFHLEWLGLLGTDTVPSIYEMEKDRGVHERWGETLRDEMRNELFHYVENQYASGAGGTLTSLLAGRGSYLSPTMAEVYGLPHPDGEGTHLVVFPDDYPRAGILTLPGVLAVYGKAVQSAPIQRGVLVRDRLLCLPIIPPPPGVMADDPEPDPSTSRRQQFEEHGTLSCGASCHQTIDPIGFAMEHFDGIGQYREVDGPVPVDATGRIPDADVDRDIDGAVELADALAESETVRVCFTRQWARFALGREIDDSADACAMDRIRDRFRDNANDLETLLVELALSEAFGSRTVE